MSGTGQSGNAVVASFRVGFFANPQIRAFDLVPHLVLDPTLEIGTDDADPEWSVAGAFETAVVAGGLGAALNVGLAGGACSCTGCTLNGDNCEIPFRFTSGSDGAYRYSELEIPYVCW